MLPWEVKAAELEAAKQGKQVDGTQKPQYVILTCITDIDEMTDGERKKALSRIYYVWKLSCVCAGGQIASAVALFCSQVSPYYDPLAFLLPSLLLSVSLPFFARITWLPAVVHSVVNNNGAVLWGGFVVPFVTQMVYFLIGAVGIPAQVGGGGGLVGAVRALIRKRWTAGMIAGASGTLNLLVGILGLVAMFALLKHLRT